MQQLTSLDAHFLNQETKTAFHHIGPVAILGPGEGDAPLTLDSLRDLLRERLHLVPPFRRRLHGVPLGIDEPYWIDDPEFDLDSHLHEATVAPPGDSHQLAEAVAAIAAQPLDRSRPLWEVHLLHGLADDQVGVVVKMHHAAIDGHSANEVIGRLLDPTPEPAPLAPPEDWVPGPPPSGIEMLARGAAGMLRRPVRMMHAQQRIFDSVMRHVPGHFATHGGGNLAPRTRFNRTIGRDRAWAFADIALNDVRAVKDAFGVTVNDVVMAMCAGALRRWLQERGELPDQPLVACTPVSVRAPHQYGLFGNQVSLMLPHLPTNVADPVERLEAAHHSMAAAKHRQKLLGDAILKDLTQLQPPMVATRAAQLGVLDPMRDRMNVAISNVMGPPTTLYLAGRPMVGHYPVSFLTAGQGLNITVLSYNGNLGFGLLSDPRLVPREELQTLTRYLADSLDELSAAAERAAA